MTSVEIRPPRFNHVAMSVPADLLDEQGRADLVAFYSEVFGFQELPTMTENRRRLVFGAYTIEQFVFLIAGDDPPAAGGAPGGCIGIGGPRRGAPAFVLASAAIKPFGFAVRYAA